MTKRYLVVGINDYTGLDASGKSNLSSCVADANSMSDLLVSSFGFTAAESQTLTDQQASSAGIQAALRTLLAKSTPGDVVCLYYSGHGARIPGVDTQADCDKFYECIVPASGAFISDRDLFTLGNTLEPSVVNFTVILDSCHSGGMDQETDASFKCKSPVMSADMAQRIEDFLKTLIPCGILIPPDSQACADNVTCSPTASVGHPSISEDPDKVFIDQAKTTLIAGCKFDELSWETGGHGLLTKAFLNIINACNFQVSYSDLLDQLRTNVTADFNQVILPGVSSGTPRSQTPQLRGQKNRMSDQFLDGFVDSR